jgi:hypothetical protein
VNNLFKYLILLASLVSCSTVVRKLPNNQREIFSFPNLTGFFEAKFNWPLEGEEKIYRLLDQYTGKALVIDRDRKKKTAHISKYFYHENLEKEWTEAGFYKKIKCLPIDGNNPGQEPVSSMKNFVQLPVGYERWKGLKSGGCGNLALIQSNRNLGLIRGRVSPKEWNKMAEENRMTNSGHSNLLRLIDFYRKRSYCIKHKQFYGFPSEYKKMKKLKTAGCSLVLSWLDNRDDADAENATHMETVVRVHEKGSGKSKNPSFLATNHYGKLGFLIGGGKEKFSLKPDSYDVFTEVEPQVMVTEICPCVEFKPTLRMLLKEIKTKKN